MTELKAEQQLVTASEENNEPQSLLDRRLEAYKLMDKLQ